MPAARSELRRPLVVPPEPEPRRVSDANSDTPSLPRGRKPVGGWQTHKLPRVIGAVGLKFAVLAGCADESVTPTPTFPNTSTSARATSTLESSVPVTATTEKPPQTPSTTVRPTTTQNPTIEVQTTIPEGFMVEKSDASMDSAANQIMERFQNPKLLGTNDPDYVPVNDPPTSFQIVVNNGSTSIDGNLKYQVYTITLDKQTSSQGNTTDAIKILIVKQYRHVQKSYDPSWYGDSTPEEISMTRAGTKFVITDSEKTYTNTNTSQQEEYADALSSFNRLVNEAL